MDVCLLSVPMDGAKKPGDKMLKSQAQTNYGLLSVASFLTKSGFTAQVVDPHLDVQEGGLGGIVEAIARSAPGIVGLSCISGYSYPNLIQFVARLRERLPEARLVAGGQDHVGRLMEETMRTAPGLDAVVHGEGERSMAALARMWLRGEPPEAALKEFAGVLRDDRGDSLSHYTNYSVLSSFEPQDYSLYEGVQNRCACIEVARGCTFHCAFCSNIPRDYMMKSPREIVEDSMALVEHYGDPHLAIYYEAPLFIMNTNRLKEMVGLVERKGCSYTWRAQTRVDVLKVEHLPLLRRAGMRVVDLGLESASPEQLVAMKKTERPDAYVEQAARLLRAAHENGIIAKLNILFYAGERPETLAQTLRFLEENARYVKAVSAYPLLVFPGTKLREIIDPILNLHDGSVGMNGDWEAKGIYPVNPSSHWSYEDMQKIGIELGKSFQTLDSYYEERKYGYLSASATKAGFAQAVENVGYDGFPFSRDAGEMLLYRKNFRAELGF